MSGRQKAKTAVLDDQAGQPSGRECPGIDVNSVRKHLGRGGGGVAMDYYFTEMRRAVEEFVADP